MKTLLTILIAIALLIYSAKPTISFAPFKITFESPYMPFFTIFLVLAIFCISIQSFKDGYKKGVKDFIIFLEKDISEINNK